MARTIATNMNSRFGLGRRRLVWAVTAGAMLAVPIAGPASGQCIPPPAGLISWWPADGNANDIQDGNDGTLVGGAGFATGQFGEAFVFGGVSADGVVVPDHPSLDFGPTDDFSIDAWILAEVSGSSGVRVIVDKRDAPNGNTAVGYVLFLFNGRLGFQLADAPLVAGAHTNFVSPGPDLRDGTFHHVAVTVVRSSSTGGKLYVDGVVVFTFDPTLEPGNLSNNKPLLIGKHQTVGFSGAYRGRIDEVEIFDRALSASEILDLFNAIDGKCKDSDGDGVLDDFDCQPNSDLSETVVIDGCDSGVENVLFEDGCTILDLIFFCADDANNHGDFVSCVAHLTNDLVQQGIISGQQKGAIQSCAAQADIPS